MTCSTLRRVLPAVAAVLLYLCSPVSARQIVDMAGRTVAVPAVIRSVAGLSPPATYMVYAMDPSLLAGLNFPFNPHEKRYLDARLAHLPVIGGWFGQGRTPNLETLLQVRPDIMLVWMWRRSAQNEKLEQTLAPLNLPIVYLTMDQLTDYPAAFRFLGDLFNLADRGAALARYAEETLAQIAQVKNSLAQSDRLSVYYAEGPDGLSTECDVSEHAELIPLCGAANVHRCTAVSSGGMQKVTLEQVLRYDPQVIVAHDPVFLARVFVDQRWRGMRAVREGRVLAIPRSPFNWFDRPPSFMRFLGARWLMHGLYPQSYPIDMVQEVTRFYSLFLNVTLDDVAVRELIAPKQGNK